nr:MAG TPA: major capsid protein [Caudoviricetes sp.]
MKAAPTPNSDEKFTQLSLSAHKLGTFLKISEEPLTDAAFDVEAYLAAEFAPASAPQKRKLSLLATARKSPPASSPPALADKTASPQPRPPTLPPTKSSTCTTRCAPLPQERCLADERLHRQDRPQAQRSRRGNLPRKGEHLDPGCQRRTPDHHHVQPRPRGIPLHQRERHLGPTQTLCQR